ncbi:MAG: nickel pincer cofactor biosynthesis protein LarC [Eubacteriales bacterium]
MKVLYYDCFCGISGDMNLGALIDVGVEKEFLIKEIAKLNLEEKYELRIEKTVKNGIIGTKVDVILGSDKQKHRYLKDIEKIINLSNFNDRIKKMSLSMFLLIAKAEAKVHGKSVGEVHFHEVGALDSIIDIVGAAICLDYLKVDKIKSSFVQVGGGFVKCAHGLLPVPTPATVEILKNIPIKSGIAPYEMTTPTGAVILASNVDEFTEKIDLAIDNVGYGIGTRDLEIPNVLRVYLGTEKNNQDIEKQYIIETNIDDMNPELYGYIEERLFQKGALDVFKTPIIMKKGRSAIMLSVLIKEKDYKAIQEVIFRETTSIGIRQYGVEKIMLDRDFSEIQTCYGKIMLKNSYYNGEKIRSKPEYEDCKKIAKEKNIPITDVYREVDKVTSDK